MLSPAWAILALLCFMYFVKYTLEFVIYLSFIIISLACSKQLPTAIHSHSDHKEKGQIWGPVWLPIAFCTATGAPRSQFASVHRSTHPHQDPEGNRCLRNGTRKTPTALPFEGNCDKTSSRANAKQQHHFLCLRGTWHTWTVKADMLEGTRGSFNLTRCITKAEVSARIPFLCQITEGCAFWMPTFKTPQKHSFGHPRR